MSIKSFANDGCHLKNASIAQIVPKIIRNIATCFASVEVFTATG